MTRPAAAVIFDMDGVLVDGEPLHFEIARRMLADEGVDFAMSDYRRYLGTTLEHTWDDLRSRYRLAKPYGEYAGRYHREVTRSYQEEAELLPGAAELLERLHDRRVPLALASSSDRIWVDAALGGLGIARWFGATVAGDEVARGKPDPEIYLAAARLLGADPAACIAVEDAPAGIASAKAAGMSVIAVRTEMTGGTALDAPRIIDDLGGFDLEWTAAPQPAPDELAAIGSGKDAQHG